MTLGPLQMAVIWTLSAIFIYTTILVLDFIYMCASVRASVSKAAG